MWTATAQNWSKSVTHIERRAGAVGPRGFGKLNPSPHSWIFTSVSGDSSSRFYLFTSATVRIAVHSTPKCGTEPIRYVTLHFLDGRGAARCSFTPLHKFRQNHRSHVWTEAVSNPVLFLVWCEHSFNSILIYPDTFHILGNTYINEP